MGAYSELDITLRNGDMPFEDTDGSPVFVDDDAFAEDDSPCVQPPAGTGDAPQTEPVPDTPAQPVEPQSVAPAQSAGDKADNDAQKQAGEDAKRKAHEEAETKRKAEFDARQAAKKAAEQEQLAKLESMSQEELLAASMQRVSADTEKLTRRNMKECVSEFVQTKCLEDPAFARMVMHPKKSMVHCLWYINRKAREYIEQEMKDNGEEPRNAPGGIYGGDVPDELCYQWAEEYFRDPNAEEDHRDEEKFVPKPYYGGGSKKSTPKAKKEKDPPKKAPAPQKPQGDGEQLSLLGEAS